MNTKVQERENKGRMEKTNHRRTTTQMTKYTTLTMRRQLPHQVSK